MKQVLATLALSLNLLVGAQSTAQDILNATINSQRGGSQRATISMTVIKPNATTEYVIESIGDGADRSLVRVVAPPREAGQAFLTVGDNLYLYNPRLRRTLRLPPSGRSDSFLGSDISYSDLGGRDLETDYSAEVTAEDAETVELTLIPEPLAPTPYGKIVLRVRQGDFAPLEYTFFDQREQAVRRILFSEYFTDSGLTFPTRLEVINLLREGERTVIVLSDFVTGVAINEACFTERALERGCD